MTAGGYPSEPGDFDETFTLRIFSIGEGEGCKKVRQEHTFECRRSTTAVFMRAAIASMVHDHPSWAAAPASAEPPLPPGAAIFMMQATLTQPE